MSTIKSFWRGEEALWRVWLIAFPIAWAVLAPTLILSQKLGGGFAPAVIAIFIVNTWLLVSVWRCAKNAKLKFWFIFNRGYILLCIFIGFIAFWVLNLL